MKKPIMLLFYVFYIILICSTIIQSSMCRLALTSRRRCYRYDPKTKRASDRNKYKEEDEMQGEVLLLQELVNEFESTAGKKIVNRLAKQMAKFRQDVVGVNYVKDVNGKVLIEND